jgi:hypothetical protein
MKLKTKRHNRRKMRLCWRRGCNVDGVDAWSGSNCVNFKDPLHRETKLHITLSFLDSYSVLGQCSLERNINNHCKLLDITLPYASKYVTLIRPTFTCHFREPLCIHTCTYHTDLHLIRPPHGTFAPQIAKKRQNKSVGMVDSSTFVQRWWSRPSHHFFQHFVRTGFVSVLGDGDAGSIPVYNICIRWPYAFYTVWMARYATVRYVTLRYVAVRYAMVW